MISEVYETIRISLPKFYFISPVYKSPTLALEGKIKGPGRWGRRSR